MVLCKVKVIKNNPRIIEFLYLFILDGTDKLYYGYSGTS